MRVPPPPGVTPWLNLSELTSSLEQQTLKATECNKEVTLKYSFPLLFEFCYGLNIRWF